MTSEMAVALRLTGHDFSPEKVIPSLGVSPTNTWRLGDTVQNTLLKKKHDRWEFALPLQGYLRRTHAPARRHQHTMLGLFGPRHTRHRSQAVVEAGLDADITAFSATPHLDPLLGTPELFHRIVLMRRGAPPDPQVPDATRLRLRPPLREIVQETARHFGVEAATLDHHAKGRGHLPRVVAMALCRRPGGDPLNESAQVMDVRSSSPISVATTRLGARLRNDSTVRQEVEALTQRLFTGEHGILGRVGRWHRTPQVDFLYLARLHTSPQE
jgi:hypothetical protein